MIVTEEWIKLHRTPAGGWTRPQFEALGLPWNAPTGWIKRVSGNEITDEAAKRFEEMKVYDRKEFRRKLRQKQGAEAAIARKQRRKDRKKAKQEARRKFRIQSVDHSSKYQDWRESSRIFFESREWKALRYKVLQVCGAKCQCCGASAIDGAMLHVDHIKPRYHFPELELDISNLQVLCSDCNVGKGAGDQTDWRTDAQREILTHMRAICKV